MRGMGRSVRPREPSLPDCATNPHAWDRAPNGPRCRSACGPFPRRSLAPNEDAALHPTTCLVVWLLSLLAIQRLEGGLLAAAFLVPPLFGWRALQRATRLAWGARWLFLSLFVILAWGRAGEPVWSGATAPSVEGLSEALTQIGRLLLVLMAVAVLRQRLPVPELLTAAHRLLRPLRRCGVDTDRGIVRVLLVLQYLETTPRPRDWRMLLEVPAVSGSEVFELSDRRFPGRDYLLIALLLFGVVLLFSHGQA
jgi:hypothetical protein